MRDRDRNIDLVWIAIAAIATAASGHFMWRTFELADPYYIYLLVPVWLTSILYLFRSRKASAIALPTLDALASGTPGIRAYLRPLPFSACLLAASLFCLAMTRPQSRNSWQDVEREGIDIMIALDVSTSMLARDLQPDRLEASKRMGIEFIEGRPDDRIGLVLYEGEAFTQCPLTTDHRVLKDLFLKARSGLIEGGTAVGMGLATAINRLRESTAKSKVVILLTDGVNNAGTIQPLDAAQIAAQLGIRVYTIGVGTKGKALSPISRYPNGQFRFDYVEVDLDEPMMREVAQITGGEYFRATNERKLGEIYQQIDTMEKTIEKVTEHSMRTEEFTPFVLAGGGLLLFGFLLDRSLLRTVS